MNVYIWRYVRNLTDNYHSGGGLVVFAETEARARELANLDEDTRVTEDEKPDEVREASGSEAVFVFPDAGCC